MVDLSLICVTAMLPALVGGRLARRVVRARAVRRELDRYLAWLFDDLRPAVR
jgi:hypothetical protein